MMDSHRGDVDAALRRALRPSGGEQVVVAFQGERGAYGHLVVDRLWGARAWDLPCRSFADAMAAVARGRADFAVLPLHNEIIGEIPGVRAALEESGLAVVGHLRQPVRHCLLAPPGSVLAALKAVYSHPAALAQCAAFLQRHPALVPVEAYDTAGAARDVAARGHRDEGAIAAEGCAERYELQLLARDVGDRDDNVTTFAIVRRGG